MNASEPTGGIELVDEYGRRFEVKWLGLVGGNAAALGGVQFHHGRTLDGKHVFAKVVRVSPVAACDVDDLGRAARETAVLRLYDVARCEQILPLIFAGFAVVPGAGTAHVRLFPFAEGGSLDERLASPLTFASRSSTCRFDAIA
jgi:hypothetical protein